MKIFFAYEYEGLRLANLLIVFVESKIKFVNLELKLWLQNSQAGGGN
jgi:hypothetical protein